MSSKSGSRSLCLQFYTKVGYKPQKNLNGIVFDIPQSAADVAGSCSDGVYCPRGKLRFRGRVFAIFLKDRVFHDFPAFLNFFVALHVHTVHCSVSNVSSWRLFTQI